jgi:O-antigen/teichoic acid export membrane protein
MSIKSLRANRNSLFVNYSFNLLTQFGSAALSFLTILVIKKLSADNTLAYIISIVAASQFVLLFVNWSLVSINRLGLEEFISTQKISKIFSARAFLLLISLAFVSMLFPVWSHLIARLLKIEYSTTYFVLVYFLCTSISMHYAASFAAIKQLKMPGVLFFLEKLLILLFISGVYFFYTLTWQNVLCCYIAASAIIITISQFKLGKYFDFQFDRKTVKLIAIFSLPIIPYTLTAFFTSNYLDTFFISKYLSKFDIVVYSISYQVYGLWTQLPLIFSSLILPRFVELVINKKDEKITYYLSNYLHIVVLFWILASVVVAFLFSLILPGLFSINHPQFKTILALFFLSTSLSLPGIVAYSPLLLAKKILSFSFPLAIVTAVFNVSGNVFLMPIFGLKGCAYATIISNLMGFLATIIFLRYRLQFFSGKVILSILPAVICIATTFFVEVNFIYYCILFLLISLMLYYFRANLKDMITLLRSRFKKNSFS